ncbi:hypothetical protein D9611_005095 [Ephemerocybe angulata]|uniref:Exosome complex protein n=1 Tax=Ephemerocybe angulata TaxID=980116 RepID=A0A8H5C0U5_9AGAR|nr:hypothetical protein D9611_005095 [Tulosesus angulatus]
MSIEISKLNSRVNTLSNSLDDLEGILESLFSQTLPETVLNLEPLQQAKLQTDVPYVIYDLVFMYLKLKGIDPKGHPVIGELDRIRQYFDKISHTENPPTRPNQIDKAAAGRFIKHAISSVKWTKTAAEEAQEDVPEASSSSRVPAKITTKMFERQEYEKQLKEKAAAGEDEEDDLEVFDDEDAKMDVDVEASKATPASSSEPQGKGKRRRPVADPFADVGEPTIPVDSSKDTSPALPADSSSTPQPKQKKSKSASGSASKKKKTGMKKSSES